jgi:choline dehydrogenase
VPDNGGTFEHLIGKKIDGSPFDDTNRGHTAADLLQYANPDRITVLLWANTQRVRFNKSNTVLGPMSFPTWFLDPISVCSLRRSRLQRSSRFEVGYLTSCCS